MVFYASITCMTTISTQKQIPAELTPAYARPVDAASIDSRMADQLDWEAATSRHAPRDFELDVASTKDRRGNKPGTTQKALRVGLAALAAAGAVKVTGEAIDHELKTGESPAEIRQHVASSGIHNSFQGSDGKIHIYPNPENQA